MSVTAQYIDTGHTAYVRSDMPGAVIPVDPANRDHAETLEMGVLIAAYVPQPRTELTYAEFRARFTEPELAAIRQAVLQDAEALDWTLTATADNRVRLDSPITAAFLDKMVTAEILTEARRDEVLTP